MGRRPLGAPATESDAETRFLQLCRSGGLVEPSRQLQVVPGRRHRVDFGWPSVKLAVEIDGRVAHGPDQFGPDLRRQNRIVLAGWVILRFTREDVVVYPQQTLEVVRAALAAASLRVSP